MMPDLFDLTSLIDMVVAESFRDRQGGAYAVGPSSREGGIESLVDPVPVGESQGGIDRCRMVEEDLRVAAGV